ncbi:MAG TPA: glycosyltransferase family 39 protein [Humisphaera sp.]|nr:glycosyltransferase family 39 protein [Humisphaera sp.]
MLEALRSATMGDSLATKRCVIYVLLLTTMASIVYFVSLGRPTMAVDEAQYALCVEHARESGNWLTFTPYPPHSYFLKPPMYFWLTGLTYRFFDEGQARYRFWSALFGVGSVALTCVLGAMLVSPEAGLLAGLLLLGNRYFQNDHGARTGSLDTAVTFLVLICLVAYWLMRRRRIGAWAWMVVGAMAGLACLFKPAAGAPILMILAVHAIALDEKGKRISSPLRGIIGAVIVALVVVAPYYAMVWSRAGGEVFHEMLSRSIVQTAVSGDPNTHEHMFRDAQGDPRVAPQFAGQPWYWILLELHRSSIPFALAGVGILFAMVRACRGQERGGYALLVLASLLYLLIFSLSVAKRIRYVYPVFPSIAIAIAASWIAAIEMLFRRGDERSMEIEPWRRPRFSIPFATICVVLILFEAVRFTQNQIDRDHVHYQPWNVYQALRPAIRDRRLQLVFFGFPSTQYDWRQQMGLDAAECFYLEQMHGGVRVNDAQELKHLLAQNKPTLLLESRYVGDDDDLDASLHLPARTDDRCIYDGRAFSLRGIDMQPLLDLRLAADSPCPDIKLLDASGRPLDWGSGGAEVTNRFIVRITPPLRCDAWLMVSVGRPATAPDVPIRFHAKIQNTLLDWAKLGKPSQTPQIATKIGSGQWSNKGPTDVTIQLLPESAGYDRPTIRALVSETSLRLYPEIAGR